MKIFTIALGNGDSMEADTEVLKRTSDSVIAFLEEKAETAGKGGWKTCEKGKYVNTELDKEKLKKQLKDNSVHLGYGTAKKLAFWVNINTVEVD